MENITPRAILKHHGNWITASEFVDKICEKRKVKSRQAKNLIADAYNNKQVIKHIFSDRTVIYGLPEFGSPTFEMPKDKERISSDFYNSLVFQFWKEREEAQQLRLKGNEWLAWEKTQRFCEILPASTKKEQLIKEVQKVNGRLNELKGDRIFSKPNSDKKTLGIVEGIAEAETRKRHREFGEKMQRSMLFETMPRIWEKIASIISEV